MTAADAPRFAPLRGANALDAILATTVERQFMPVDREAWRCQRGKVARAAAHVEDTLAVHALEVVVVPAAAAFEPGTLPGQFDGVELPLGEHRLEVPVHGRDPEAGRRFSCGREDFPWQQGTTGTRDSIEDRRALARVSFHRAGEWAFVGVPTVPLCY